MKYKGIDFDDYSKTQIEAVIDEWIHSERDRQLLKRRILDGILFEPLSEEFGLSTQQTKYIVGKCLNIIYRKGDLK